MSESDERLTTNDLAGAPTARRSIGADEATAAPEGGVTPVAEPGPDAASTGTAAGAGVEQREAPSRPPAQPDAGGHAPTDELPSLFPADEANAFLDRWGEVQSRFVGAVSVRR